MVLSALGTCLELIHPRPAESGSTAQAGARPSPLFKVGAILSAPEVLVSPPLAEVRVTTFCHHIL
jgi:hypothetical protein